MDPFFRLLLSGFLVAGATASTCMQNPAGPGPAKETECASADERCIVASVHANQMGGGQFMCFAGGCESALDVQNTIVGVVSDSSKPAATWSRCSGENCNAPTLGVDNSSCVGEGYVRINVDGTEDEAFSGGESGGTTTCMQNPAGPGPPKETECPNPGERCIIAGVHANQMGGGQFMCFAGGCESEITTQALVTNIVRDQSKPETEWSRCSGNNCNAPTMGADNITCVGEGYVRINKDGTEVAGGGTTDGEGGGDGGAATGPPAICVEHPYGLPDDENPYPLVECNPGERCAVATMFNSFLVAAERSEDGFMCWAGGCESKIGQHNTLMGSVGLAVEGTAISWQVCTGDSCNLAEQSGSRCICDGCEQFGLTSSPSRAPTQPTPEPSSAPTMGTCLNGAKDLDESDIDCGGLCTPCGFKRTCATDDDCASARCTGGVCTALCTYLLDIDKFRVDECKETDQCLQLEFVHAFANDNMCSGVGCAEGNRPAFAVANPDERQRYSTCDGRTPAPTKSQALWEQNGHTGNAPCNLYESSELPEGFATCGKAAEDERDVTTEEATGFTAWMAGNFGLFIALIVIVGLAAIGGIAYVWKKKSSKVSSS